MRYYFYKDENGVLQASKKEETGVCAVWDGEVGHNIYAVYNDTNGNMVVSERGIDIGAYLSYERLAGLPGKCFHLVVFQWNINDSVFALEKVFTAQVRGDSNPIFETTWDNIGKIHQFDVIKLLKCYKIENKSDKIRKSANVQLWYYDNDDSVAISTREPISITGRKFCDKRDIFVYMNDFAGMEDKAGHVYTVYYDYSDVNGPLSKADDTTFITGDYVEFVNELLYRVNKLKTDNVDMCKQIKVGVFKVEKNAVIDEFYIKHLFTVSTTGRVDMARGIDYNLLTSVCTQVIQ